MARMVMRFGLAKPTAQSLKMSVHQRVCVSKKAVGLYTHLGDVSISARAHFAPGENRHGTGRDLMRTSTAEYCIAYREGGAEIFLEQGKFCQDGVGTP